MHLVLTPLEVLKKLRHQHFSWFEKEIQQTVLLFKQISELRWWYDMLCSQLNLMMWIHRIFL